MSSREVENVCNYLRSRDIQLSPNNVWLSSCIHWYNSHLELRNIYGSLEDYVCVQWLLADLQDVQNACLPINYEERVIHLNGKYAVQVNWIRDIAKSCYSQLQTIKDCDESQNYVSEDEPKKQIWEPKAKRVLMMEVTDGVTNLKAMEYSPIPKLFEPFIPGTKVVLNGPIECRSGILLLKNDNLKLLGGEVEQLSKKYSLETILSKCLNLVKENETEGPEVNNTVPRRLTNSMTNSTRPPQSAFATNNDVSSLDRSNLMLDEDDEFLCDLPDEVLHCPEDREQGPSPVLDNHKFEANRQVAPQNQRLSYESPTIQSSVNSNKLQAPSKPKLFPSLEDLHSIGRESPSCSNSLGADSSRLTLGANTSGVNIYLNKSFGNLSSTNQLMTNNTAIAHNLNSQYVQSSNKQQNITDISLQLDDDSIEFVPISVNKYPQLKEVLIKIENITKLKIRNGEWYGCASVLLENQQLNITFSNEVLEMLFGIPASEVEVWRGEMSTNPSLKKKVNDILKTGQTKLKLLRCPMTLKYSSEDCTPEVIAIQVP